jgi:hypothetical protein
MISRGYLGTIYVFKAMRTKRGTINKDNKLNYCSMDLLKEGIK